MKNNTVKLAQAAVAAFTKIESSKEAFGDALLAFHNSTVGELTYKEAGSLFSGVASDMKLKSYCLDRGLMHEVCFALHFVVGYDRDQAGDFLRGMDMVTSARVSQIVASIYGKNPKRSGGAPKKSPVEKLIADIGRLDKLSKKDIDAIVVALKAKLG